MKTSSQKKRLQKELEKIVKGFANHRRIEILELLQQKPELSLIEISDELEVNIKTVGAHTRRLLQSGLVMTRHEGPAVRHTTTKRGKKVLMFLRTLA